MIILILGCNGLIGNTISSFLNNNSGYEVWGAMRKESLLPEEYIPIKNQILNLGINDLSLNKIFTKIQPNVVINCIGLTKHRFEANNLHSIIDVNSLFPHKLAKICTSFGSRLIHISTDCVFSGLRGNYSESDVPDALDEYGKSKSLGEIKDEEGVVTIRTSTIGHEIGTKYGLLEWFLNQKKDKCKGFKKAVFSGIPTVLLAEIINDYFIPNNKLFGLFHVAGKPISKYELLKLIAKVYNKSIEIIQDDDLVINRSLNGSKFNSLTGFRSPDWEMALQKMHDYQKLQTKYV